MKGRTVYYILYRASSFRWGKTGASYCSYPLKNMNLQLCVPPQLAGTDDVSTHTVCQSVIKLHVFSVHLTADSVQLKSTAQRPRTEQSSQHENDFVNTEITAARAEGSHVWQWRLSSRSMEQKHLVIQWHRCKSPEEQQLCEETAWNTLTSHLSGFKLFV